MRPVIFISKSVLCFAMICLLCLSPNHGKAGSSSEWNLNANNWTGTLTLDISGSGFTGTFNITKNPSGTPTNQHETIKGTITGRTIEFVRTSSNQKYTGVFSLDGNLLAGTFTQGSDPYPWFAVKH